MKVSIKVKVKWQTSKVKVRNLPANNNEAHGYDNDANHYGNAYNNAHC